MEKLCYKLLEKKGYDGYLLKKAPERVLQFGEGNFLRAFVDYFMWIYANKREREDIEAELVEKPGYYDEMPCG